MHESARGFAPLLLFACILVSGLRATHAQSSPSGSFQVSSDTTVDQRAPAVGIRDDGSFVVVWHSGLDTGISGQRFDRAGAPTGGDFRVSDSRAYPFNTSIAMGREGDFVAIWNGPRGILRRRFDSAGVPRGKAVEVGDGYGGSGVASNPDGSFVVVWANYYGQGYGELYDTSDRLVRKVSLEDPQNAFSRFAFNPAVAMDVDGDFVAVWASDQRGVGLVEVLGQRFDSSGARIGGEFQVNAHTVGFQGSPAVATAADGSFVVVWTSDGQDGYQQGVFGRRYDAAGRPAGEEEFQVNARSEGDHLHPTVAMAGGGDFFVAWTSEGINGNAAVVGQRYDAAGRRLGGELRISDDDDALHGLSRAATAANGTLVVVWESRFPTERFDILARRFASSGSADGDRDGDGVKDQLDNCPSVFNPEQTDLAFDGYGDDCVSPDAIISPTARLGFNPIVGRGTSIGNGAVIGDDVVLGELVRLDRGVAAGRNLHAEDFVTVGRGSTLGDDVSIGFATRTEPAVAVGARVVIGDGVVIKRNAVVSDGVTIDALAVVFAGARIGAGATIETGARVGRGATVRPGAVVPAGTSVPPGITFP